MHKMFMSTWSWKAGKVLKSNHIKMQQINYASLKQDNALQLFKVMQYSSVPWYGNILTSLLNLAGLCVFLQSRSQHVNIIPLGVGVLNMYKTGHKLLQHRPSSYPVLESISLTFRSTHNLDCPCELLCPWVMGMSDTTRDLERAGSWGLPLFLLLGTLLLPPENKADHPWGTVKPMWPRHPETITGARAINLT